jgi:hypothetical protein
MAASRKSFWIVVAAALGGMVTVSVFRVTL